MPTNDVIQIFMFRMFDSTLKWVRFGVLSILSISCYVFNANPSMQIIAAKGCFCRVNRKSLLQWIDYYSNLVAIEMRKWQEMGWVMRWSHSADWFSVPWNPFDRFLCIKHSASLHESLNFAENREQCQRTEYLLNGMRSLLYLLLIGLNIWQRFRSCLSFTPNAPSFRLNLDGKWFTW